MLLNSSVDVLDEFIALFTYSDEAEARLFSFDARRSTFTCLLCDCHSVLNVPHEWSRCNLFAQNERPPISSSSMHSHRGEVRHDEQKKALQRDLQTIWRVLQRQVRLFSQHQDVVTAVNEIGSRSCKNTLQAAFFRYLVSPVLATTAAMDSATAAAGCIDDDVESESLRQVLDMVDSYQNWDRFIHLHLSAWKARCLQQMQQGGGGGGGDGGGYLAVQRWKTSGWKEVKAQQQHSNAMSTIVSAVQPFLEGSSRASGRAANVPPPPPPLRLQSYHDALSVFLSFRSSDEKIGRSMHFRYGEKFESSYKCALCRVDLPFNAKEFHYYDLEHERRERGLYNDLQHIKVVMQRLIRLFTKPWRDELDILDQMVHVPWRNAVQAELFRCVFEPAQDDKDNKLENVLIQLRRYECWERLVLIGLAVWKAQCLWQMPGDCDYFASEQWIATDWKTCKAAQRESSAMDVIVKCVRPFLDPLSTPIVGRKDEHRMK
jgi:hypothetical protein